jgi:drug/metabolite transporter (DMT)-like permease
VPPPVKDAPHFTGILFSRFHHLAFPNDPAVEIAMSRKTVGIVCGVLAAVLWGGGAVVSRHLVTAHIDPMDMVLLRYAACFPIAVGLLIAFGRRVWLDIPLERLLILLLLAGPPYHLLLTTGYEEATAGAGSLLVTGLLTVFSLAVPLAFSSAKPSTNAVLGAALACVGLTVFAASGSGRSITAPGFAIFSAAALSWAVLNALIRHWKIDPLQLTVGLALWSVLFLPVYTSIRPWHALAGPAPELLLQFIYQGWLVAFAATLLFFVAIRYAGAPTAAALQALAPGVSACFGAVLLAEPIGRLQIVGLGITILGVMFASGGESWLTVLLGRLDNRREAQVVT